ncbi:hypothetical protein [Methylobacterium pseudosasicola]|uniref:Uncharacterized protein n=1 Tax=Methylobacterium pseudosasicola TaxID=582667 RepID=A0A1I4V9P7_9HYPH|nr:hypothetical protein [Methylobacterium pseudosasicola]SFM97918.1 hypothetical protein SAMN05192568_10913 [Methylobacterium pseudosasicola]
MTPAEWASLLDVVAKVEAIEAHHAGRIHRDPRGLKLAQEAVQALRSTVATAAPITPALSQPERPDWVRVSHAPRFLPINVTAARMRAKRGQASGTGRKVGRHWELHLPSQPEVAHG